MKQDAKPYLKNIARFRAKKNDGFVLHPCSSYSSQQGALEVMLHIAPDPLTALNWSVEVVHPTIAAINRNTLENVQLKLILTKSQINSF